MKITNEDSYKEPEMLTSSLKNNSQTDCLWGMGWNLTRRN